MGGIHLNPRGLLLAASVAAVVGAAAYAQSGGNPNGPKMANVPGLVSASPAGSAMLTGHFEIRPAEPGEPGIFSSTDMGGACLVAKYPANQSRGCTKHTDCALPSSGIGAGAASYCLPESPARPTSGNLGAVPPTGAGTCWIKPSEDFCLKRQGPGAHDTNAADSALVAKTVGVKQWRVLTCLNGIPAACAGAPATPNEYQHQSGPVYTAP